MLNLFEDLYFKFMLKGFEDLCSKFAHGPRRGPRRGRKMSEDAKTCFFSAHGENHHPAHGSKRLLLDIEWYLAWHKA